jgi:hypothetical protein
MELKLQRKKSNFMWTHYHIVFKIKSPLHIGYHKIGNLLSTRSCVPGKNIWAVFTSRITRANGKGNNGRAYIEIGKEINDNFRFSYFWPAISPDNEEVKSREDLRTYFNFKISDDTCLKKIYPMKEENDIKPFDYLFMDSYVSTALDYSKYSAEEGSLHEVEFISPVTRDNRPVYLVGSIWIKKESLNDTKDWEKCIKNISIGGEQKYGWGRLELPDWEKIESESSVDPDDFIWKGSVPVHVKSENAGDVIQGLVEPLVGWEMQEGGEHKISPQKIDIAFSPGSVVKNNVNFKISKYGVWEKNN